MTAKKISSYYSNINILFAIYVAYLDNAIESLNEHFQGMKEPGPKLRKSIWHYLAEMKNNPNYARILIMAQRENPEFYASEYVRYIKQYSGLILKIIDTGQKEGLFLADMNPRLIRNMALGTSVFTAFHSIVNDSPYDPNDMSDVIYQLVINAAGAEAVSQGKNSKLQRKERTEFRRTQIIENAVQVFSMKGFSSATISEVAKKANLGDATLYEYFDNKEAILLGLAESYLQNLISTEDMGSRDRSGPEKSLRDLLWRWIWQLYTYEDFSRVLVLELFRNINFYASPAHKYLTTFWDQIQDAIEQGQKTGLFRRHIPFPTYFHMIAGTFDQFLLSQFLLNKPPLGLSELNDIVDAFVRAIKVRENRST